MPTEPTWNKPETSWEMVLDMSSPSNLVPNDVPWVCSVYRLNVLGVAASSQFIFSFLLVIQIGV